MLRGELRWGREVEKGKKENGKAPFKGRYSTTVAFIVRISTTKKKQVRLESVTSVPREQRADDQCDVRWWASRSGGSPLIID